MNLETFGQRFRELRERRGMTQGEVVTKSRAYKSVKSIWQLEAGEIRPRRPILIALLVKGLEETSADVINEFLAVLDYDPLRPEEVVGLRLTPAGGSHTPSHRDDVMPPTEVLPARLLLIWRIGAAACGLAAIAFSAFWRDSFVTIFAILYSVLYAVSVLLESAHEFRGGVTITAASLAGFLIWLSALAALWIDATVHSERGIWIAGAIFTGSGLLQWMLVRPALSAYTIVPGEFQMHTARTAHLKNTGYFLLLAFSFLLLPLHCVANRRAGVPTLGLCPRPEWLLGLLLIYAVAAMIMGHVLLSNVRDSERHDFYVTLFYTRAFLYFLLSLACVLWYWSAAI